MTTPVRYADMRPQKFRERIEQCPVAFLPLGTVEWHGEQLPLGSDAIISEGLMCACASRFGGVVMPPIHVGPDRATRQEDGSLQQGMDMADVTVPKRQLDGSCYWISEGMFNTLIDAILEQLKRAGFVSVFADGHGPSRRAWVSRLSERKDRFGLDLFGVTEEIVGEWKSQIDHAAKNETSMVMALRPELVDLDCLDSDRGIWPQGVAGEDPRDSTVDYGQDCINGSVEMVGRMVFGESL